MIFANKVVLIHPSKLLRSSAPEPPVSIDLSLGCSAQSYKASKEQVGKGKFWMDMSFKTIYGKLLHSITMPLPCPYDVSSLEYRTRQWLHALTPPQGLEHLTLSIWNMSCRCHRFFCPRCSCCCVLRFFWDSLRVSLCICSSFVSKEVMDTSVKVTAGLASKWYLPCRMWAYPGSPNKVCPCMSSVSSPVLVDEGSNKSGHPWDSIP